MNWTKRRNKDQVALTSTSKLLKNLSSDNDLGYEKAIIWNLVLMVSSQENFDGYEFVQYIRTKNGNTTHIYRPIKKVTLFRWPKKRAESKTSYWWWATKSVFVINSVQYRLQVKVLSTASTWVEKPVESDDYLVTRKVKVPEASHWWWTIKLDFGGFMNLFVPIDKRSNIPIRVVQSQSKVKYDYGNEAETGEFSNLVLDDSVKKTLTIYEFVSAARTR